MQFKLSSDSFLNKNYSNQFENYINYRLIRKLFQKLKYLVKGWNYLYYKFNT